MYVHSCHILFDHFQFTLIHGPNIPGSYATLLFTAFTYSSLQTLLPSPVTSTTGCYFCFGFISSSFLELFLHSSPVVYWAPTNLGSPFSVSYLFAFSYCLWGSQGKNAEVVCNCLLQWTTFCQNSPLWSVHLGWPYMAWLIVSLSRQGCVRFMWSIWLVFCDCGFHSVGPLMDKDKRLADKLPDGRDWLWGNWVLFWWAGPCSGNLWPNFLLIGRTVFPPCCLAWGQTMVGVMMVMGASFKRA